ncbi:MAG: flagellar basal body-associated FliL family protein [Planctomycetota bacterium]|jgi:flagellar basal body-associated protein FliL
MADADDTKEKDRPEAPKAEKTDEKAVKTDENPEKTDEKAPGGGILPWIIMAVIVAVCAGAGFGLGRLFARPRIPETAETSQEDKPAPPQELRPDDSATDAKTNWYYDFEPVVANLDVPGVTRYVRATLTLEISRDVDKNKGTDFINEKKPVLTNWLTIYLASLTLEDIRGNRNLKRIQSHILDAFNEKLFPDAKPQIKHILFKEFAIQ